MTPSVQDSASESLLELNYDLIKFALVLAAHSLFDRTPECHWDWCVF